MISNKGFIFFFIVQAMCQACYGGVKQEDFQIIYHIILVQANGTKYFPLFGRFLRILLRLQAEEICLYKRGTKNEVMKWFLT